MKEIDVSCIIRMPKLEQKRTIEAGKYLGLCTMSLLCQQLQDGRSHIILAIRDQTNVKFDCGIKNKKSPSANKTTPNEIDFVLKPSILKELVRNINLSIEPVERSQ